MTGLDEADKQALLVLEALAEVYRCETCHCLLTEFKWAYFSFGVPLCLEHWLERYRSRFGITV